MLNLVTAATQGFTIVQTAGAGAFWFVIMAPVGFYLIYKWAVS